MDNNQNNYEEVEYLDFDLGNFKYESNELEHKVTEEDMIKIKKILKTKSKNEKTGFYGLIILIPLCIVFVIFSFVLERKLLPIVIAILSGILGIMFLGVYLVAYGKRKRISSRNDIEDIKNELAGDDITVFESAKVYLTKSYIISHGAYSNVLKYEDIALIYNERRISKVNGVRIDNGIFVIAILKSGKKVNIMRNYSEQDIQLIEQIILEHNPNIMMGLREENKEKLKEIKREYKNAKKR